MIAELISAFVGKIYWNRICKKNNIDSKCAVLVLSEKDELWNNTFLKYSKAFCSKKNLNRVVIISIGNSLLQNEYKQKYIDLEVTISEKVYSRLLRYYLLIEFSDNVVFCCKDSPYDNESSFIIDKTDISLDEYVCYGLYKLRGIPDV